MAHSSKPTTGRDLAAALHEIDPVNNNRTASRHDDTDFRHGVCMDECYPGLYIGDIAAAKKKDLLVKLGITHVLNTAQGNKFASVDTDAEFYSDINITYLGMRLLDVPSANITQHFDSGAQFIDDALSSGGKVLVHCFMGISRSATISCAFLMLKRSMSATEAIQTIRKKRAIFPNDGFLNQLAHLDNKLRGK